MKARYIVFVMLAAAVTLSSVAAAGPGAARQRVEITATGVPNPASALKFVLTPLSPGGLTPDSGTEASVVAKQRVVTRDGRIAVIVTWVTTCKGKRGSFVLRVRIEHIDAGNGFHIGVGTWRFVRGTARTRGSQEGAGSRTLSTVDL